MMLRRTIMLQDEWPNQSTYFVTEVRCIAILGTYSNGLDHMPEGKFARYVAHWLSPRIEKDPSYAIAALYTYEKVKFYIRSSTIRESHSYSRRLPALT